MNWAHLHLVLNHIPLLGIGFTAPLLLVAMVRRSNELLNVSLVFAVLLALWAIPVCLTGEPAVEVVEGLPGISG